jgi:integrase
MEKKGRLLGFQIRSFVSSNGERFSLLFSSEEAFPLFYPTAFISRSKRLNTTPSTQLVYLDAIKRLLEWEAQRKRQWDAEGKIGLEVRFQRHEFLRPHELDDLAHYLNAARYRKQGDTIGATKGNTYISYAAQYLKWIADELITDGSRPDVRAMIDTQDRRLKEKLLSKTGSKSAKNQGNWKKHLPEDAREQLHALWNDPFVGLFRTADRGARLRTVVMLRILYETGMRRGELLSLKLKNVLDSAGGQVARLVIERNHGDSFDTRVNQPVPKTRGRIVPITAGLERQLTEYIAEYRADVPRVGFDEEDFIFVTHRNKRSQGAPLSISAFDQALTELRKLFCAFATLHPHLLRHDWNYRFSLQCDKAKWTPEKERASREILMGWAEGSESALIYNLRHTQEQAICIGLQVAGDTERPALPSKRSSPQPENLLLWWPTPNEKSTSQ